MRVQTWGAAVVVLAAAGSAPAQAPKPIKNVVIYREKDRTAGWPANNGCWSWGDEIVVGFMHHYYKENPRGGHPVDPDRPGTPHLVRTTDGGNTWQIEIPSYAADRRRTEATACPGGIDFTHPDFAMVIRGGSFSWSHDRCKTWNGPFELPTFGRKRLLARTDYIVNGKHDLTAMLAAAKEDGQEGWPFCARTTDGGKTWKFLSWIGAEPGAGGYAIMPSAVRLSDTELFAFIRCRSSGAPPRRWWIEPWRSLDDGQTWTLEKANTIDNHGNPPHMIKLKDGRLALTYGVRSPPYGIRARLSGDNGRTWGPEIVLRDDGGVWDLGYPRTAQRADGKIVTAYYFNEKGEKERHVEATIWDPGCATD